MAKLLPLRGGQVIEGMNSDPTVTIYNLRRELAYMRQNLNTYQASANKAEDAQMNLAYELKVVGNK